MQKLGCLNSYKNMTSVLLESSFPIMEFHRCYKIDLQQQAKVKLCFIFTKKYNLAAGMAGLFIPTGKQDCAKVDFAESQPDSLVTLKATKLLKASFFFYNALNT